MPPTRRKCLRTPGVDHPFVITGTAFPFAFPAAFGAGLFRLPPWPTLTPAAPIVSGQQTVSIHTNLGVQLYQFPPEQQLSLRWTRTLRDTSVCDLQVPSLIDGDRLPNLVPWLHWISVWEPNDDTPVWSGPIRAPSSNDTTTSINAVDISDLASATRTPMTKRWDAADPAYIAAELYERLIEHHGLRNKPTVRPDPEGKRYDYQATMDAGVISANMDELVAMGLRWTIVRGVPILGPAPAKPIAALGREHFTGDGPTITRDGRQMFNDVLIRAPDNVARAVAPMGGLNRQTIVNMDSMFGVSNVQRAALDFVKYSAAARDVLSLPGGVTLVPDAPVTLAMLIPSTRFVIEAYGLLTLQELTAVEVTQSPGEASVKVTMASVQDNLPELIDTRQAGQT